MSGDKKIIIPGTDHPGTLAKVPLIVSHTRVVPAIM